MEERVEAAPSAEQPNKKQIKRLFGIALTLVILMILLVLAALGFLLYGLIAARLAVSIIGVVACVISFGLLFGLFRLINKILRRRADELAGVINGLRTGATEALTVGRETYAKVQEELSPHSGRAKTGND